MIKWLCKIAFRMANEYIDRHVIEPPKLKQQGSWSIGRSHHFGFGFSQNPRNWPGTVCLRNWSPPSSKTWSMSWSSSELGDWPLDSQWPHHLYGPGSMSRAWSQSLFRSDKKFT